MSMAQFVPPVENGDAFQFVNLIPIPGTAVGSPETFTAHFCRRTL